MNANGNPRPVLRLTSVPEASTRREPDPKAVRRTLFALHGALNGVSATTRDIMYYDDMPDRLEAVAAEIERLGVEARHLLAQLGR